MTMYHMSWALPSINPCQNPSPHMAMLFPIPNTHVDPFGAHGMMGWTHVGPNPLSQTEGPDFPKQNLRPFQPWFRSSDNSA